MPRRPVRAPVVAPRPATVLAALVVLAALALLGACQSGKDPAVSDPSSTPTTQAESAAAVKRAMQPLLELGTSPRVSVDEPVGCTGDPQGETFAATYSVTLTLDAAARDRLVSQVVPSLTAQGWHVRESELDGGLHRWSFQRGDLRMGVSAGTAAGDEAGSVQGSGPCLPRDS